MATRRYNNPINQDVSTRYASDLNDQEFALTAQTARLQYKRPTGLPISCRKRAAQNDFKKQTISRAKRSAA